jgi:hypothetical protein
MADLVLVHLAENVGQPRNQLGEIDMAMGIDKHARYCTRSGATSGNLTKDGLRRLACGALPLLLVLVVLLTAHGAVDAAETSGITPLNARDCSAMLAAHVITQQNPLPCTRLARVSFSYVDFDGRQKQDGEMIVMDAVAPHVQHLFAQLHAAGFPLHSAHALTYYRGDDLASMADNNSSAFNGRAITGGSSWSKHAYGVAIDINPLQNPYLSRDAEGRLTVLPPAATATERATGVGAKPGTNSINTINTTGNDPGNPRKPLNAGMAETVRMLFANNGFLIWGGTWRQPIDYQHFEIGERAFIEKLTRSTPDQAGRLFERYVRTYRNCVALRTPAGREAQCAQKTMRSVD